LPIEKFSTYRKSPMLAYGVSVKDSDLISCG